MLHSFSKYIVFRSDCQAKAKVVNDDIHSEIPWRSA